MAWQRPPRGLYYVVDAPGRFSFGVPTAQAEQGGWSVADALREPRALRLVQRARLADDLRRRADVLGRGISRHGRLALPDAGEQARQHASPAEVAVPEAIGRLNRSTPGDANNDGYNESRGAYQIIATGPRVELTITPRTSIAVAPGPRDRRPARRHGAGEHGGPAVGGAVRLANGDVLIELPAQFERATLMNVRVQ